MDPQKKAYKAGDVIQDWTKPFVKVLSATQKGRRCDNCFKQKPEGGKLWRCAACQINYYCSKRCQKSDWKFAHSAECKTSLFLKPDISGPLPVDPKLSAIVARIHAHLKLHPEREFEKLGLYDGSSRSFSDLLAHVNDGDKSMDYVAEKMSTLTMVQEEEDSKLWSVEFIRKLLGIWKTNAFVLLDENEVMEIGSALYVEASVFNHSCRPNALRISYNEQSMQVRAIGDIPPGEPPCITYLAGIRSREERQKVLKERYNFDCKCDLCEAEEKSGPITDYELLEQIKMKIFSGSVMSGNTLETVVAYRDKALSLYKPLFHPYDERVTNFSTGSFKCIADHYIERKLGRIEDPEDSVKKLAENTLRRLEITFGKGYFEYQEMKSCMIRLKIKVSE